MSPPISLNYFGNTPPDWGQQPLASLPHPPQMQVFDKAADVYRSNTLANQPKVFDFYGEALGENVSVDTYKELFDDYVDSLKTSPMKLAGVITLTLLLTTLFTVFPRHRKGIDTAFLLAFMYFPVASAVKNIPAMIDAYKLAKSGEDSEAKYKFNAAFKEFGRELLQDYVRPFTAASLILFPLLNPRHVFRGGQKLCRDTLKWVGKRGQKHWAQKMKPTLTKLFNGLDKTFGRLDKTSYTRWMNRQTESMQNTADAWLSKLREKL